MLPPDALREALGQVIADQRREWRREREVMAAQGGQAIAELRAENAELRAENTVLRAQMVDFMAEMRAKVDARLAEVKDGAPGQSVVLADVEPMIEAAVSRAVDAIPRPKDGQDGASVDMATVESMVDSRVAMAVAAIPAPKDGEPGRDGEDGRSVTSADIEPLVASAVEQALNDLARADDEEMSRRVTAALGFRADLRHN